MLRIQNGGFPSYFQLLILIVITWKQLSCPTCVRVIDLSCSASKDFFKLKINSWVPLCPSPGSQNSWKPGSPVQHTVGDKTNSHQAEPPVQLPTNQPTLTKYSYQTSCHLPLPSPCSTPPSASQPRIGPPSGRSGRNWLVTFIIESLYLCQPWCCAAVLLNSQNLTANCSLLAQVDPWTNYNKSGWF